MDATLGCPMSREVGYGITDVWDDMVGDMEERAPTTLEELSQRVTELATTLTRDTHEMAVHAELLAYRAQTSSLQTQLTAALGRIHTLEARVPARIDDLKDANSIA
ncbi:hypothetical protein Tco_1037104 [Tanacetum coccineum]